MRMGSIAIVSVIISMGIFGVLLFWGSLAYSYFFSRTGKNYNFRDFYECGFKSTSDNRLMIDIQFSITGLIFLVYEMEIVLFVPILLNSHALSFYLIIILFLSFFILGLSYWYEWERYALNWMF
jgi:NADH:ubiquinone oxidoreductase subunit 3 (subunit A)